MQNEIIFKYELTPLKKHIDINRRAVFLKAGIQKAENGVESLFVWYLVPHFPEEGFKRREYFEMIPTGYLFEEISSEEEYRLDYIDTILFNGGDLVYHLFKKIYSGSRAILHLPTKESDK